MRLRQPTCVLSIQQQHRLCCPIWARSMLASVRPVKIAQRRLSQATQAPGMARRQAAAPNVCCPCRETSNEKLWCSSCCLVGFIARGRSAGWCRPYRDSRFERGVLLGPRGGAVGALQWSFSDMHRSEGQIWPLARRASFTRIKCWLAAIAVNCRREVNKTWSIALLFRVYKFQLASRPSFISLQPRLSLNIPANCIV
jgi:hypothetical protein